MNAANLEALLEARRARRPVVRLAWLESGREQLVPGDALHQAGPLADACRDALAADRAALVDADDGPVFVHPFNPPLRLAIIGAVHIAQRLAALARDLGYAVSVIDPRRGFLTEARFPDTERCHEWPDAALERFAPDARSAIVALSHDPKIDEPALESALRSPAFYVGALGSRRTQAKRRERLQAAGLDDAALARIHGPVGLDLGAKSPAEIALSIAAQMTAVLRGRDG